MASLQDMGREELVQRLENFDKAVCLLHPGRSFRMVIVGGGALVLMGCIARSTSDLDALVFPADLYGLMERYDISGRVKTYENEFSCDLSERLHPIDVQSKAVEYFSASLEDIVIAKLHSFRDRDAADIRDPQLLKMLDWGRLQQIAEEMDEQCFFARRHREFRLSYEQYREECGPCAN